MRVQDAKFPIRGETADISLGGLYLATMFPFGVGTEVDITLELSETTVLADWKGCHCDPGVGNEIYFCRMLPEDRDELDRFLHIVEAEQAQ